MRLAKNILQAAFLSNVGGCVKNTNALFYCYFLTVSCHSERSEESDNVCFIFLLMFTDSSLRSE